MSAQIRVNLDDHIHTLLCAPERIVFKFSLQVAKKREDVIINSIGKEFEVRTAKDRQRRTGTLRSVHENVCVFDFGDGEDSEVYIQDIVWHKQ